MDGKRAPGTGDLAAVHTVAFRGSNIFTLLVGEWLNQIPDFELAPGLRARKSGSRPSPFRA